MQAHIINYEKQNPVDEYVIDDGKKEIPVKNKLGEVIAVLRFRTTDVNIVKRAEQAEKGIFDAVKCLNNVEIKSDGTAQSSLDTEVLKQAEDNVREQINYIFNDDVCSELFKACNPFSPIGGRFFAEIVVEMLVKIINNEMSKQQEENIRKYTDDLE